jgi:DNA-binding beta-propeller fold protein YncE
MKKSFIFAFKILITFLLVSAFHINARLLAQSSDEKSSKSIQMPEGSAGIGFDDLRYSPLLNKVLIPAGRTGMLNLLDPENLTLTGIGGFSSEKDYKGGHGEGITSVDEGKGVLFVTDRSSLKLNVIDPASKRIISSATLSSSPDYVRFLSMTNEIWVTEPDSDRIEIFALSKQGNSPPAHSGFVQIKGGPEALVFDSVRGRAYTHLWHGKTVVIDLKSRAIVATWTNGCEGSRGIALDPTGQILFVGCAEGKAVSIDVIHDGKMISTVSSGSGVDIIDYNEELKHLYLPGGKSATMAIIRVSDSGELTMIGTVPTVEGAHCVTSDRSGNVYICDPHHGQLMVIRDQY